MHLLANLLGPNDLIKAILNEDWYQVKALCDKYPYMSRQWQVRKGFFDGEHDSYVLPIHQALASQSITVSALDSLINAYPSSLLTKETSFKRTPVHVSIMDNHSSNNINILHLLLSYVPDAAQERDVLKRVPLHYACSNGPTSEIVKELLKAYPDGNRATDIHGWLPIHVACYYGCSYDVIKTLVDSYPGCIHKRTEKGSTPLKLLKKVQCHDKMKIQELLVDHPSTVHEDQEVAVVQEPALTPMAVATDPTDELLGTSSASTNHHHHDESWLRSIEVGVAGRTDTNKKQTDEPLYRTGIRHRHPNPDYLDLYNPTANSA